MREPSDAAARPSPRWRSRIGVGGKRILLGVAWLTIWGATLAACAEFAFAYCVTPETSEGFGAALGMVGGPVLGPVGCLLSYLVARRADRTWIFLVGAALTGIGTVPLILYSNVMLPLVIGLGVVACGLAFVRGIHKTRTGGPR